MIFVFRLFIKCFIIIMVTVNIILELIVIFDFVDDCKIVINIREDIHYGHRKMVAKCFI